MSSQTCITNSAPDFMKPAMPILLMIMFHNLTFGQNKLYDSLRYQLQLIERNDQGPRIQLELIRKKYANDTLKLRAQLKLNADTMRYNDSADLNKVKLILENYGWLGPDEIGDDGCQTLFIVIQHADLKTQERYLPMMREAVKAGKVQPGRLAYLEDRISIRKGKEQVYGTQVFVNVLTNEVYVFPLVDPEHVDMRRSKMGLGPMADYLQDYFNSKWDVPEYFRTLRFTDSLLKANPF